MIHDALRTQDQNKWSERCFGSADSKLLKEVERLADLRAGLSDAVIYGESLTFHQWIMLIPMLDIT